MLVVIKKCCPEKLKHRLSFRVSHRAENNKQTEDGEEEEEEEKKRKPQGKTGKVETLPSTVLTAKHKFISKAKCQNQTLIQKTNLNRGNYEVK